MTSEVTLLPLYKVFIDTGLRKILLMLLGFSLGVSLMKSLWQYTKDKKDKKKSAFTKQNNISIRPINKTSVRDINITEYYKKRTFFTSREDVFYRKLATILYSISNRYTIFSKVRVVDVVSANSWNIEAWKKINSWHFDYVICDTFVGFEVMMVIELDDESHRKTSVQYRDTKKNEICNFVWLPLIRFNPNYNDDMIIWELQQILKLETSLTIN